LTDAPPASLVHPPWRAALVRGAAPHVQINFTSFIAYPITFGIGVDYAANTMSRYVQGGRART
jgi:hypothetical protein